MSPGSGFSSGPFSKLSLVYANSKSYRMRPECNFTVSPEGSSLFFWNPDFQDYKGKDLRQFSSFTNQLNLLEIMSTSPGACSPEAAVGAYLCSR